jgi:hypothetical protein
MNPAAQQPTAAARKESPMPNPDALGPPQRDARQLAGQIGALRATLDDLTDLHGGYLRCEQCGSRRSPMGTYLQFGWPDHCGQTMVWWTRQQIDAGEVPHVDIEVSP